MRTVSMNLLSPKFSITQSLAAVARLLQNFVSSLPSMACAMALFWYWGMLVEMAWVAANVPKVACRSTTRHQISLG